MAWGIEHGTWSQRSEVGDQRSEKTEDRQQRADDFGFGIADCLPHGAKRVAISEKCGKSEKGMRNVRCGVGLKTRSRRSETASYRLIFSV